MTIETEQTTQAPQYDGYHRFQVRRPSAGIVDSSADLRTAIRQLDRARQGASRLGGYSQDYLYDAVTHAPINADLDDDGAVIIYGHVDHDLGDGSGYSTDATWSEAEYLVRTGA